MKRLICIICALFMAATLTACSSDTDKATPDEAASSKPVATIAVKKVARVKTPYVELAVSEEFDENVKASVRQEDPYILDFVTKEGDVKVLSLHFNDKTDYLLGTIKRDGGDVVLYAEIPNLDEKSADYQKHTQYQMELNTILSYLMKEYEFAANELPQKEEDNALFAIKTDLVTLYYPKKWEKKVTVTKEKNGVKFAEGKTPLFDLVFEKTDGEQLGTYKDTPIYIVKHKASTDEQKAMLQAADVIIDHLREDKNFKAN